MHRLFKKFIWIFLALGFLLYSWNVKRDNPKPVISVSEQNRQLNFSNNAVQVISLGQQRLLSSVLWIQTLLDGDLEHYKGKDLNSWMYLRFDLITDLDPSFYEAYLWGGQYLSIIKDDALGAKNIYNKGLRLFPNDLDLNFNSGFNYFFELKKLNEAIKNFEVIVIDPIGKKRFPALFGLYQKMKYQEGSDAQNVLAMIKLRYETEKNPRSKKYYEMELHNIQTTEDLKCLNRQDNRNCRVENIYGERYIQNNENRFISPRPYRPYYPSEHKK